MTAWASAVRHAAILAEAARLSYPTLFTGHFLRKARGSRWWRNGRRPGFGCPTHPTLAENLALVASCGATTAIGHSCDRSVLDALQPRIPQLDATLATGDHVDL